MKKYLLVLVIILLIVILSFDFLLWRYLVFSSRHTWVFTHSNGKIEEGRDDLNHENIDSFIATKPSGKMTYYDKSKTVFCEYFLKNGEYHKSHKTWGKDGFLNYSQSYNKGQKHGVQASWWLQNVPMSVEYYANDSREGSWTNWHENGSVAAIVVFSNNLENGRCLYFSKSGRKIGDCIESNGYTISGTRIISKKKGEGALLGSFTNGVLIKKWFDFEKE
ncbi:MAG: hypothetical protein PHO37_10375 [Kiritimatiellae bacterium]|nr:hypothetical protein [Kiritimatiellia bacterium]